MTLKEPISQESIPQESILQESIKGHCLCGAVTYIATGVERSVHSCHCQTCRRWTGGPAFAVQVETVAFEGEQNVTRYDSSSWAERGFCHHCGTHLFYRVKATNQYVIWMGTFEKADRFHLAGEIFIDEKPSGYEFAGDHPRLTGAEFMKLIQNSQP